MTLSNICLTREVNNFQKTLQTCFLTLPNNQIAFMFIHFLIFNYNIVIIDSTRTDTYLNILLTLNVSF
jgi:hypothetical protein